jgi:hypothetical protein
VSLINRKQVLEFALHMAKRRAHKFTRFSEGFPLECEGGLKTHIRKRIHRHPTVGQTQGSGTAR